MCSPSNAGCAHLSLARRSGDGREDTRSVHTVQVCAVSKNHFTQNLRGPLQRLASLFVHELPIFTDTPAAMPLDSDDEVRLLPRRIACRWPTGALQAHR